MATETARLPGIRPAGVAVERDPAREAARRLVEALAARDYRGLFGVLARDARLRFLIPSGPGEIVGAAEVAARFFEWFGDADAVEAEDILVERVSDRTSARYRFLVHEPQGWEVVEQQAYLDVDGDGSIAAIDLLCSGFRPTADPEGVTSTGTHRFDAGTMGCSDGLAAEFRRRIGAIPVGDVLVVTARDPAAKEDLPPLARMMGHTIRSVETMGDGRLTVTVERGR